MLGVVLMVFGWLFYGLAFAIGVDPWYDRLIGVALGLFIGGFLSCFVRGD